MSINRTNLPYSDGDHDSAGSAENYRGKSNSLDIRGKQLARFSSAADRLHAKDTSYGAAVYIHFLLKLLCIVLAVLMLRLFIVEPTYVDGESMINTLMDHERVLVEKVTYWFDEPKRGDIVIVHFPGRTERFVKRVMAVGGETITIRNGWVYIDGVQIDESAYAGDWYGSIVRLINTKGALNGSYTVPEGYIFVMGDNRNWSHDSRAADVGPIALDQVVGKACAVIWPLDNIHGLD